MQILLVNLEVATRLLARYFSSRVYFDHIISRMISVLLDLFKLVGLRGHTFTLFLQKELFKVPCLFVPFLMDTSHR